MRRGNLGVLPVTVDAGVAGRREIFSFAGRSNYAGRFEERLVQTAARACIQLTEGEVMEGRMRGNAGASLEDYTAVITRKTASLFAAGGRVAEGYRGSVAADHRLDGAVGTGRGVGVSDGR